MFIQKGKYIDASEHILQAKKAVLNVSE